MSFPFEIDSEIEAVKEPVEYEIDSATGQLTGKKVTGIEAIKAWAYMALHTPRYRHIIYSWDYGSEIEELIGQTVTQEYLDTEIPRIISDCLTANPHIKSISNIDLSFKNDKLSGNFSINTDYGEVTMSV
ncbi:DUF2634 domain-containing protein [Anaerocolumna chitinilytica]|uniref:DUF2634 domain-containing protein n=1 Tax=Anaerocolumna chitinilytica TaxID=1727145 RepID=A0A7M3S9Y6_9FIRM|nr:DUF2634 domain-containing protein [Anaerocolumna chitinilytica]BCK01404.1 hypothetical protein bsdcttw_44440 [Anaerocolumna chitinilytica]